MVIANWGTKAQHTSSPSQVERTEADQNRDHHIMLAPASAVCAVSWLLARALFRKDPHLTLAHIALVFAIVAINLAPAGWFGAMLGNV